MRVPPVSLKTTVKTTQKIAIAIPDNNRISFEIKGR